MMHCVLHYHRLLPISIRRGPAMQIDVPWNFVPMEQFSLRWRWTDPKYRVLSGNELALVRPFDASAAAAAHSSAINILTFTSPTISATGVASLTLDENAVSHDASGEPQLVRHWLRELISGWDSEVIISWDPHTAVLAPWSLFVAYWDDFCYPSSDDVFVFPLTGAWLLYYEHEEIFYFRHL
jgi:hypothetical protein